MPAFWSLVSKLLTVLLGATLFAPFVTALLGQLAHNTGYGKRWTLQIIIAISLTASILCFALAHRHAMHARAEYELALPLHESETYSQGKEDEEEEMREIPEDESVV